MPHQTRYVIAYDIADDKRRTKLARLLLDYGDRFQLSLFEADLSAKDVEEILKRSAELVTETDSLRLYALCADCSEKVQSLGRAMPMGVEDLVII